MTSVEILSPAKINLHLEVGEKRGDGYHSLLSLFALVSLFDKIEFSLAPGSGSLLVGPFDCPPEENIITKAIELFRSVKPFTGKVIVNVDKKIPSQAGLGGGSSNGVATLSALGRLTGSPMTTEELFRAACRLGSDTPFFSTTAPAALVKGRGEVVEPIPSPRRFPILLLFPPLKSSTKSAFKLLSRGSSSHPFTLNESQITTFYRDRPPLQWPFFNSFFSPLKELNPTLLKVEEALKETGAQFVSLSGSGTTLFALYREEGGAELAKKAPSLRAYNSAIVHTLTTPL